jgi:hypothetical protein
MDHAHALSLAKRTGLGMSGALNGAIAAAFLGYAGISLFDAVGMAAALMIFGWTGGFIGVTVASSQLAGRERERLSSGGDPSEVLSSVGTFVAQCGGFDRGVALPVQRAPHRPGSGCNRLLVVIRCHAADRGGCVGAPSQGRTGIG